MRGRHHRAGIAHLQATLRSGALVKLLGAWSPPRVGCTRYCRPADVAPKARAFVDFHRDWLARHG
jgi:DNA-binding transcriptional LysR family regulator